MELNVVALSDEQVKVGYECVCGCRPKVRYEHGSPAVEDRCCCGRAFIVGPEDPSAMNSAGDRVTRTSFAAPWGETVPAVWIEPEPAA